MHAAPLDPFLTPTMAEGSQWGEGHSIPSWRGMRQSMAQTSHHPPTKTIFGPSQTNPTDRDSRPVEIRGGAKELHWPSISVSWICKGQSKISLCCWVMQCLTFYVAENFQAKKDFKQQHQQEQEQEQKPKHEQDNKRKPTQEQKQDQEQQQEQEQEQEQQQQQQQQQQQEQEQEQEQWKEEHKRGLLDTFQI